MRRRGKMGKTKNKRFSALLLAGILLLENGQTALASEVTGRNVLAERNTGFEGVADDGVPYWWYGSTASIVQDKEVSNIPEGASCVKVVPEGAGSWIGCAMNTDDLLSEGIEYGYSFSARLAEAENIPEGAGVSLVLNQIYKDDFTDTQLVEAAVDNEVIFSTDEWTTVTGSFTVSTAEGKELKQLHIVLSSGDAAVPFYADNLVIYEKGQSGPISIEMDIKDLKDQFAEDFGGKAGVAIPYGALADDARMALVTKHYNSVTAENEMKPDAFLGHSPNIDEDGFPVLNFATADIMLDYILEHNAANPQEPILVRGHVLVWHSQTPEWFFHENYDASAPYVSAEVMNARLENYISKVLNHFHGEDSKYKGLIYAWDVVNEAVNDSDGGLRTESSWYNVYGSNEFILNAFKFANQYAPSDVKLFYNDYNETTPQKCVGICNLLEAIKAAPGTRIDGMGMQGHYNMDSPTLGQFEHAIRSYAAIVDEVQITELDMKASNDYDGTNKASEYTKQAYRYKDLFDRVIALKEEGIAITAITLWGTHDSVSWLQTSNSVGGAADGSKPQCPLFFDDNLKAKPAYWALVDPSRLEPSIQNITVMQMAGEDLENIKEIEFTRNGTAVTFKTAWKENCLVAEVQVADATASETDGVTLYLDAANTAADGAKVDTYTVARTVANTTEAGYIAKFEIPMNIAVGQKIGFDIAVNNDGEIASFNNLKNSQAEGSKYYAQAIFKPYTSITKGTVTVDGQKDDAWENVEDLPLNVKTGTVVASAEAKLLWDEENLYVYAKVTDPVLNAASQDAYQQDSLEVFIDENNHKTEAYEADDKQYRISYENVQSFNGSECKAEYMNSATELTEDGYLIEASFKWTEIAPKAGDEIGVELQINEAGEGGSRTGTISWFDESGMGWSAPSVFGTAKLVEASKEETKEPGTGEVTPGEGQTTPGSGETAPGNNPEAGTTTPGENAGSTTTPENSNGNTGANSGQQAGGNSNTSTQVTIQQKEATEEVITVNGAKVRVLKNSKIAGLMLEGKESLIPSGADFKVQVLTSTSANYVKATSAVLQYIETQYGYAVYELDLLSAGGEYIHALNGDVKVHLPIPAGLTVAAGQEVCVYRLESDGTLTKCPSETKGSTVSFTTNHFSTYVFAVEKQSASPKTSDNAMVTFGILMLFAAFSLIAAGYKTRYRGCKKGF